MDGGDKMWEGIGSIIENAEPCAVVGGVMLARRREESLHACRCCRGILTSMMGVVKVHESPNLQRSQPRGCRKRGGKRTHESDPMVKNL